MLGLRSTTDPSWVDAIAADLPGLLSDHAHCELKAAQNALSIIARFGGEAPALVAPLTELAIEETEHFGAVRDRMTARNEVLGPPSVDPYAVALRKAAAARNGAPVLLDRLLVAALIEARSCERFRVLSERLPSADLRSFYRDLMASEARHYRLFVGLAEELFGPEASRGRLDVLREREAEIATALPLGPTVHG